jgi:N,N'-diacetyllegionaminate synthase
VQRTDQGHKVIIIAEAGVNHNGSLERAFKMIEAAASAGADFVKFQTFNTELCISKEAPMAEYQKINAKDENSQFEMVKKLELSQDDHYKLVEHCKKHKIKFLSTGFDLPSIEFLNTLNIELFKVPSGEITNLPYLRRIADFNRPIILSTGMANIQEIKDAVEVLKAQNITILHCNTEYPTPYKDVNLNAMLTIQKDFGVSVGYSDHTLGIEIPIAATALGARVIEKHFTLDRNLPGPDHIASLEPDELRAMVKAIRNIEVAMGSGVKAPSESEFKNIAIARKSIVASRKIQKGETLSADNLTTKRPGTGINPMLWDKVLGTTASRDFREDELIQL